MAQGLQPCKCMLGRDDRPPTEIPTRKAGGAKLLLTPPSRCQVCIPRAVAMTLSYPERVTPHNIDKLRQRVSNGGLPCTLFCFPCQLCYAQSCAHAADISFHKLICLCCVYLNC